MSIGDLVLRALLAAAIHEWGAVLLGAVVGAVLGCLIMTVAYLLRRHLKHGNPLADSPTVDVPSVGIYEPEAQEEAAPELPAAPALTLYDLHRGPAPFPFEKSAEDDFALQGTLPAEKVFHRGRARVGG